VTINKELEAKVVRKLFADAASASWLNLTLDQRSAMYKGWLDDPEVGGRLTGLMSREDARLWIKDGPMKEYTRSIYGAGKYAKFVTNPAAEISYLVEHVLGPEWDVDYRSRKVKPLRLKVAKGEEERYFCWSPGKEPKYLIWAAIEAEADGDPTPWTLCLIGSLENPITPDEQASNLRRARRCGLELVHVNGH